MTVRIRTVAAAVATALAAAVLTACSGGDGKGAAAPAASASGTPTGGSGTPSPAAGKPAQLPLTGATVAADDSALRRAVLVVKVDNTSFARPQVGLSAADLVVEELAEGGLTRLAVLLQSRLPATIGPVRSVRTTDVGIVSPVGTLLAASGGARPALLALRRAGIRVLDVGNPGFSRTPSRKPPYNVLLRPQALLASAKGTPPTQAYLPWGPGAETVAGRPATTAVVRFSGTATARWRYRGGRWQRVNTLAADQFPATTLLVLRVRTRDAGYRDPAGNRVPETILTGTGGALLLTGGRAVVGAWSKSKPGAALRLTTAAGAPLRVPPGRVWIELVPTRGSVTTAVG